MKRKSKSVVIAVIAPIVTFFTELLYSFEIMPLLNDSSLPHFLILIAEYLMTYGTLLLFGFICYPKDKRMLRFPIAYSLGTVISSFFWMLTEFVFCTLLSSVIYVIPEVISNVTLVVNTVVIIGILLAWVKQENLFCAKAPIGEESEASVLEKRNKVVYGSDERIAAIIFVISFFVLRGLVLFGYHFIAPLTFDSDNEAFVYLGADLVDLFVGFIAPVTCFLISRGFSGSNNAAAYFVSLFYLVQNISDIGRTTVVDLLNTVFTDSGAFSHMVSYLVFTIIPMLAGDIVAIIAGVIICKLLRRQKKNNE